MLEISWGEKPNRRYILRDELVCYEVIKILAAELMTKTSLFSYAANILSYAVLVHYSIDPKKEVKQLNNLKQMIFEYGNYFKDLRFISI